MNKETHQTIHVHSYVIQAIKIQIHSKMATTTTNNTNDGDSNNKNSMQFTK